MKTIAVTGASGHVGNTLCRELTERGYRVKALIHQHRNGLDHLPVETVQGDVMNPKSLKNFLNGVDILFHLAAKISIDNKNRHEVFRINVNGTRNVIQACMDQKVKRLIHMASIHTLRIQNIFEPVTEDMPLIDHSSIAYEQSKAEAEREVLAAAKQGMDALILTPTAIIGPYDHEPSFLGRALILIYQNRLPMLVKGGYDLVDVRDVVKGAISAAEKGRSGERYLLSGNWYSLRELSEMIGKISQMKTPKWIAPAPVAHLGIPFIRWYARIKKEPPLFTSQSLHILKHSARHISSEKARIELQYEPRPIMDTLRDTFEWFRENEML